MLRRLLALLLFFLIVLTAAAPVRADEFQLPGLESDSGAWSGALMKRFPAGGTPQARRAVSSIIECSDTSGQNCLGKLSRETGHSLVPEPPERITGTTVSAPSATTVAWIGLTPFLQAP